MSMNMSGTFIFISVPMNLLTFLRHINTTIMLSF